MSKTYKIRVSHTRRPEKIIEGTIDELKEYFGYTFKVGASYNGKINSNPKTIKSFVSNLQNAYDEREASLSTTVELIKE